MNKLIDIDLEFEGFELDEAAIRKATGYAKSSASHTGQKRSEEQKLKMSSWQQGKQKPEEQKEKIGNSLRGKTLEELIGEKRAAAGREARSKAHLGKKRPKEVVAKIASTRKATGSYDSPTHGMNGKTHKEETKQMQSIKAQVRQDLKRKLGLGRNDSVPKDILEQEYTRLEL